MSLTQCPALIRDERDTVLDDLHHESDQLLAWLIWLERYWVAHYGRHGWDQAKMIGRGEIPLILADIVPTEVGDAERSKWT